MTRTPRTRIDWHDLATWLDGYDHIRRRRQFCSPTYEAYRNHWQALELELAIPMIRAAEPAELVRLAKILRERRPPRGQRAGKWERLNMETKNRLWRIARDRDLASIGLGHNSRNAA